MKEEFLILDSVDNFSEWKSLFLSWEKREPFVHPSYPSLFCNEKTSAKCAVLKAPEGIVMYPFLLRDIGKEDFALSLDAKDIITAYGYGGRYVISGHKNDQLSHLFNQHFNAWTAAANVICEVIKFHLFEEDLLTFPGLTESPLANIGVNLSLSAEEIWTGFEHKVRKNVKKAQRSELKTISESSGNYLEDFLRIYYNTMDRRLAKENYYFTPDFFKKIILLMPENFRFFHVLSDEKIISTELCLLSRDNIYSFLGGTNPQYFELRPNDLLKHEIILWGKENKKKWFVLGGGNSENDGIFKYKKSFAPQSIFRFNIGTLIYNVEKYNLLLDTKSNYFAEKRNETWKPIKGFIPEYRT